MGAQENRENKYKKVLLFYNPKAGSGLFKANLDKIIARFQAQKQIVIPIRAGDDIDAEWILENLHTEEYVKIVVAGGDGTINRVVNAMIRTGCELPMAILPAGTANDFAHYFNIPAGIDQMLDIATGDNYTEADLGWCNGSYFVNVAAIGSVIDVSQKTDATMKNALGIFAYYIRGLSELHSLKSVDVTITTPEWTIEENIFFMVVLNGNSAGGFRRLGRNSAINDGLLDVIIFKEMKLSELPGIALNVLQGRHLENQNVIYFQTPQLRIESSQPISTDIDGELGHPLPLEIESVPGRLLVNIGPATETQEADAGGRTHSRLRTEGRAWSESILHMITNS